MAPVDLLASAVISLALIRGLFLGLVREAFSLGSIAAAALVTRFGGEPFGDWLVATSDGGISKAVAPWISGVALVVLTFTLVGFAGRMLRKGVHAAGLSWADRAGGAVLGAAEGAVAVAIGVFIVSYALGRDHSALRDSKSLEALERLEVVVAESDFPNVAAPPPFRAPSR